MSKKCAYFITGLIILSFMITACAKKEETQKEVKAPAVKDVKETTPAGPATPATGEAAAPVQVPAVSGKPITEERVLFSFEDDISGWEIPDWALDKSDHVAQDIEISKDVASEGNSSLKIDCDFPGGQWTAAVLELEQFSDFSPYRQVAVDIYVPKDTPLGLRGKIILTVGDSWTFTEMTRAVPLVPGEWVTVDASIEPGSYDWKRTVADEAFRQDVRKIVVRIESNRRPVYKGPVYIDNFRLGK